MTLSNWRDLQNSIDEIPRTQNSSSSSDKQQCISTPLSLPFPTSSHSQTTSSPTNKTFHLFPLLPTEIRLQIYSALIDSLPRIVHYNGHGAYLGRVRCHTYVLDIARVFREARGQMVSHYSTGEGEDGKWSSSRRQSVQLVRKVERCMRGEFARRLRGRRVVDRCGRDVRSEEEEGNEKGRFINKGEREMTFPVQFRGERDLLYGGKYRSLYGRFREDALRLLSSDILRGVRRFAIMECFWDKIVSGKDSDGDGRLSGTEARKVYEAIRKAPELEQLILVGGRAYDVPVREVRLMEDDGERMEGNERRGNGDGRRWRKCLMEMGKKEVWFRWDERVRLKGKGKVVPLPDIRFARRKPWCSEPDLAWWI